MTVAGVTIVLLLILYALFGLFGAGPVQKGDVPLWLRSVQFASMIFQATATGLAFIVGGLFAYYKLFKEETYSKQLQPGVSTAVSYSDSQCLVLISATVENAGQTRVKLDNNKTWLLVQTRKLGDPAWTSGVPVAVFREQDMVQPNETMSDQVWIELPDDDEIALRTDFVVARTVEEEDKDGGDEVRGWMARDIVNLLDIKGKINGTSDSDVESED